MRWIIAPAPWELDDEAESEFTGEWDDSQDPLKILIKQEDDDLWIDTEEAA